MGLVRRFSVISLILSSISFALSSGQQVPLNPVSYRLFSPFILNPAIAGSKDFSSIDIIAGWEGKSSSQIISGNSRLSKKGPNYFASNQMKGYSHVGLGGSVFNEVDGDLHNSGFSAVCSYQVPLDNKDLSFLSFGAAIKGVYNSMDSVTSSDPLLRKPPLKTFYPNFDAGVYYYGPDFYAGISATNLLGNPGNPDTLGVYRIPVSRQYFLIAGYKFLISKSLNFVIEPSIILNADESADQKIKDVLEPMLKVYLQNFCFGTYFNDYKKLSFFFQYKYPRFYIGSFVEIPTGSPYFKKDLNFELAVGINFSQIKSKYQKYYHW